MPAKAQSVLEAIAERVLPAIEEKEYKTRRSQSAPGVGSQKKILDTRVTRAITAIDTNAATLVKNVLTAALCSATRDAGNSRLADRSKRNQSMCDRNKEEGNNAKRKQTQKEKIKG